MNSKKNKQKETATLLYHKIGIALADLKDGVKDKKFDKILQNASKMLAKDLLDAAGKASDKTDKKKKSAKVGAKAAGKKDRAKKAKKNKDIGLISAPKMNNIPAPAEVQPASENIVP